MSPRHALAIGAATNVGGARVGRVLRGFWLEQALAGQPLVS
jgi:hypothetical protein